MTNKGDCLQTLKDFMDALKNREDGDYNPHCRRELEDGREENCQLTQELVSTTEKQNVEAQP